ncbi:MAG: type I-E CRISPR-associated protein Cas7/Cse4/CasC, partial [Caldilineae bacterium]
KNLKALMRQAGAHDLAAGFEGALFGRFVTSDILARLDAPVHVAHAFTTHALDTEVDFFTVVDDLNRDEETGAAHAGDMELGAGIFYGYVAVDVPLLVSNLSGAGAQAWREQDHGDARRLLERLIYAIAQVTPGAKLGATAPYAHAEWMLLEAGDGQPRSLANAYLQPIQPSERIHPLAQSAQAAAGYLSGMEQMYGQDQAGRWVSSHHPWPRESELVLPLPEAIGKALDHVFGAAS